MSVEIALLAAEPHRYDQRSVDEAKAAIARCEAQITSAQDRVEALRRKLPTPEAMHAAATEARALASAAPGDATAFEAAWRTLIERTMSMIDAAREVARTAAKMRRGHFRVEALKEEFALASSREHDVQTPPMPVPDGDDTQIVASATALLTSVERLVWDEGVDRGLQDLVARTRAARTRAEPVESVTATATS